MTWWLALLICSALLSGCFSSPSKGNRGGSDDTITNSASTVDDGYGRILSDNPIILSGNPNLSPFADLGKYLIAEQDFITNNQFLIGKCTGDQTSTTTTDDIDTCYDVKKDETSSYLPAVSRRWAFNANTTEFLQVNTFGHMVKAVDNFHTALNFANGWPLVQSSQFPIPTTLFSNFAYWRGNGNVLTAYAACNEADNAYFSPTQFTLCFGYLFDYPNVYFAEDSSVIYHEFGHAFIDMALNMRNQDNALDMRTDLGALGFDEAGAIGEGLSDYYSFTINKRTHFAEWALGLIKLSRPMSEDDPIHAPGLSTTSDGRLSYPTYISYDPNDISLKIEDIHVTGQIISHYLVALTKDIETRCSITQDWSMQMVLSTVIKMLAQLGDLNTTGFNAAAVNENYVNLVPWTNSNDTALVWSKAINPINFRRFAQGMARFLKSDVYTSINCQNITANNAADAIEQLLDDYGLLLFKNYNEDGGDETIGHSGTHTEIAQENRKKSVLIPKDLLKLDPEQNAVLAFVFDGRSDMQTAVAELGRSGQIGSLSTQLEGDLPYNNGNGLISPGEFVGVALNIYNDSNSTMAGVHILGQDWDHVKRDQDSGDILETGKPCNTFADNFPSASEGAADVSGETGNTPGECKYITRTNGSDHANEDEVVSPICLVQIISETDGTKWALQSELMKNMSLESSNCLDTSDASDILDTDDCFIRVTKGADHAFFSKIDPKSAWAKNFVDTTTGDPLFNYSNLIFFEVSPSIPPGTTFDCRFRARFTNCEDCFSDPNDATDDDYLDYEYSGGAPFKIIHFQFTVVN